MRGNVDHTIALMERSPMEYLSGGASGAAAGATAGATAGSAIPGIGTAVGGIIGAAVGFFKGKFGYNEYIRERDARLAELKSYGVEDSMDAVKGWGVELNKGFTHAQIQRNLLKDYTPDYQKFLEIVFFPVLKRVNPAAFNQVVAKYQNQQQSGPAAPSPAPAPSSPGSGAGGTLQASIGNIDFQNLTTQQKITTGVVLVIVIVLFAVSFIKTK
jgi:phage tail tape-measure protein